MTNSRRKNFTSRKAVICLIIAALLLSALGMVGCGKKEEEPQGAMAAFETFIEAQKTLDIEAMISLTPPEEYEDHLNIVMNNPDNNLTYEEAQAAADEFYGKQRLFGYLRTYSGDYSFLEPGFITDVTYEIIAQYDASDDEVSQLNDFIKKNTDYESPVTDVVLLYGSYTVHCKNGATYTTYISYDTFLEIDGRWYFTNSNSYWCKYSGLIIKRVDWVYDWFEAHNENLH